MLNIGTDQISLKTNKTNEEKENKPRRAKPIKKNKIKKRRRTNRINQEEFAFQGPTRICLKIIIIPLSGHSVLTASK